MDKETKHYRRQQLDAVKTVYENYKPKIQIIKPNGQTNWMDIEEGELLEIMRILTGSAVRIDHTGEYVFPDDIYKD